MVGFSEIEKSEALYLYSQMWGMIILRKTQKFKKIVHIAVSAIPVRELWFNICSFIWDFTNQWVLGLEEELIAF